MAPSSEVWQWCDTLLTLAVSIYMPVSPMVEGMRDRMSVIAKAPWFRRVWVIQEVAYNKRVRIRVGEQEGSWDILRSLTKFVFLLMVAHVSTREFDKEEWVGDVIPFLWKDLAHWRDSNMVKTAKLLEAQALFTATDPRDKVIALHGIAEDLQPGVFEPDYRWSINETYAKFTLSVIRSAGSLDILTHVSSRTINPCRPDGLPSWTPDFNSGEAWSAPRYVRGGRDTRTSWSTRVRMKDTDDWRPLHVEGFREIKAVEVVSVREVEEFLRSGGGARNLTLAILARCRCQRSGPA